jgi:hypothetical protein
MFTSVVPFIASVQSVVLFVATTEYVPAASCNPKLTALPDPGKGAPTADAPLYN